MTGGGKAGNIISPNPNTLAVADNFKVELSNVMMMNVIPATLIDKGSHRTIIFR